MPCSCIEAQFAVCGRVRCYKGNNLGAGIIFWTETEEEARMLIEKINKNKKNNVYLQILTKRGKKNV